jgi:hypothetical protein
VVSDDNDAGSGDNTMTDGKWGRWRRLRRTVGVSVTESIWGGGDGLGRRRRIKKAIQRGGDGLTVADGGCEDGLAVPPGDGRAAGVDRGTAASGVGTEEGNMEVSFFFFLFDWEARRGKNGRGKSTRRGGGGRAGGGGGRTGERRKRRTRFFLHIILFIQRLS